MIDRAMIVIPGEPKGKQRARTVLRGGFVHSYTPAQTADYEAEIKRLYKMLYGEMVSDSEPIKVTLLAFFGVPESKSRKVKHDMIFGWILPTVKCDIDNISKIVLDALNGLAYKDDKQVCELKAIKRYSNNPRVEVMIEKI